MNENDDSKNYLDYLKKIFNSDINLYCSIIRFLELKEILKV